MKNIALALLLIAPSAACITGSFYLAVNGLDGWGWFLFVGLLLGSFRYTEKDGDK